MSSLLIAVTIVVHELAVSPFSQRLRDRANGPEQAVMRGFQDDGRG